MALSLRNLIDGFNADERADEKDRLIQELRREIQQLRYRLQCAENEIFNLTYRDDMNGGFRGRTDSSL